MTRRVDTPSGLAQRSRPGGRWARAALALSLLIAVAAVTGGCSKVSAPSPGDTAPSTAKDPMLQKLQTMTARFAPVDLTADISTLPASERQALAKLVEAARLFDALYLRQVWAGNESLLVALSQDQSELGRARLAYFLLNKGPWSRLDHNEPFITGVPVKPPQANYYPAGAAKADVEAWLATLPAAEREHATGFFTTI